MIPPLFRFDNIYRQYIACRRKKRNTYNALRFETVQEIALLQLQRELVERSYRPGRSVCFFLEKPKLREVFAADFRDRVVHHILVDHLEKIWEPVFIYDSYACRKGKGIHLAVSRLRKFLRQVTANGRRRAFYLKLDIKNYFMTIDKDILFGFIRDRLDDEAALWLAGMVLFHDCTVNPVIKGDPKHLKRIPPHKTLFLAGPGKGLPIGNLNSQFFANVYLNSLDQFIKHSLKCRHYLRYCDDFVLLAEDSARLESWEREIEAFLAEKLKLALNQRQRKIAPVSNGIDFLGYVVRPEYLLARRRVVGNMREKLAHFENLLVERRQGHLRYAYDEHLVQALQSCLASYLGHLKHANAFNLIESIWRRYPYLRQYFIYDAETCICSGFTGTPARKSTPRGGSTHIIAGNVRAMSCFFR
jgi:retron-type reverse transcriptase